MYFCYLFLFYHYHVEKVVKNGKGFVGTISSFKEQARTLAERHEHSIELICALCKTLFNQSINQFDNRCAASAANGV
jgi:hypothetical protein